MKTSLRSFALVASILSLIAAPTAHAERLGTNPHPQVVTADPDSTTAIVAYTVLVVLGV
jgi:hypothetical protein